MQVDACPAFTGGQSSYGPPDQIQQMQAEELVNIDIIDSTAITRRGTQALGAGLTGPIQGMTWFDTPTEEYLVIGSAARLYKWDENAYAELDATYAAASATAQINMAQLIELLFIVDGVSNLKQWDGSNVTDLGNTTGTPGDLPAKAAFLISATGRLWAAGFSDAPDTLWCSYFLDGTSWNADFGNIRIGQGEGDPITGIAAWDDYQIAVFKRNSIYLLRADPVTISTVDIGHSLANATVTQISDVIGCVSNRSIVRVGNDVWFLSDGGVFSIGRVLAQNQREIKQAASLPVQDIIDRINWSAANLAASFYWQNRFFIALPLDDETTPQSVLVYSTQRQSWSGLWTGWQPTCWAISKASGNERLNFGRADGGVWRWLDYVQPENAVSTTYDDATGPVSSRIVTRACIFGDAVSPKSLLSVQVEFFGSETPVSFGVRLDEQEAIMLNPSFETSAGELLLSFLLPAILPARALKRRSFGGQQLTQFRCIQGQVDSISGKVSLRAVIFTGFLDTILLEQ